MAVIRSSDFEQRLVTSMVEAATINHPLSTNETWLFGNSLFLSPCAHLGELVMVTGPWHKAEGTPLGEAGGCSGSQRLGVLSLSCLFAAHREEAFFIALHIPLPSAQ